MSRRPILMPTYTPSRRFEPHFVSRPSNPNDPHASHAFPNPSENSQSGALGLRRVRNESSSEPIRPTDREHNETSRAPPFDPSFDEFQQPPFQSWEEKKDMFGDSPPQPPRCTPSPPLSLGNLKRKSGTKMSRLSSFFGGGQSRKETGTTTTPVAARSSVRTIGTGRSLIQQRTTMSPNSPPSSSSDGYVGWPGTLDSAGNVIHGRSCSFEDGSVGQLSDAYEPPQKNAEPEPFKSRWGRTSQSLTTWGAADTSYDGSTTTASTSFSKSPARTPSDAPTGREGEWPWPDKDDPPFQQQQQREEYDQMYDLANALTKSNQWSPNLRYKTPVQSNLPSRNAQSDVGTQRSGRLNVRSLLQRQVSEPQGTFLANTAQESGTLVSLDGDAPLNDSIEGWNSAPGSHMNSRYMRDNHLYSERFDYDPYGAEERASNTKIVAPTRKSLDINDQLMPPHRAFANSQGYRGFMDKTKEVPCLMDDIDSDSVASSRAPSTLSFRNHSSNLDPPARSFRNIDSSLRRHLPLDEVSGETDKSRSDESDVFDGVSGRESDVFDGLSHQDARSRASVSPRRSTRSRSSFPESIAEEDDEDVQIVLLGGGLTAIQTSLKDFTLRKTASDYGETLTNSDIDQFGFAATPAFDEMMLSGLGLSNSLVGIQTNFHAAPKSRESVSESGSSVVSDPFEDERWKRVTGSLSEYAVEPAKIKLLVRAYRLLSSKVDMNVSLDAFEKEEDEHKAFALFEMRSRIMEKDIERGLERRGGTSVVDDIVLTAYYQAAQRIRDAVVVSKAWREGASPKDVITAAMLTRRHDHTYYLRRPGRPEQWHQEDPLSTEGSLFPPTSSLNYWWEPVEWMDDSFFSLYHCSSLGPRHLRGVEMFTIGDCQSMLLKLTNERCVELRRELNESTKRQLEAEELLAAEGDGGDDGMTDAEIAYLSAMEEVKIISKDLVKAEQSFSLVRERIQNLVQKYEQLLDKIDTESFAGASSIVTYESSYVSEHDSAFWQAMEERERAMWARRAQRAEVKAQIAAREALMLRQQARIFQEEKQKELEELQQKLCELQSESSFAPVDRSHMYKLSKSFAMYRHDEVNEEENLEKDGDGCYEQNSLDDVKRRFRARMRDRMQQGTGTSIASAPDKRAPQRVKTPMDPALRDLFRSAGEEMCQQLDFYERSLRAIDAPSIKN